MVDMEFSRPVKLDAIGSEGPVTVEADAAERAALAERFGLLSLDALSATLALDRTAGEIVAVTGQVRARLSQPCVATAVPVHETIDAPVLLRMVPPGSLARAEEEVELGDSELDVLEHDGRFVDLGEIAAQSMALALDPYPRAPDAEATLKEAGVVAEDEHATGPFAALKALKKD